MSEDMPPEVAAFVNAKVAAEVDRLLADVFPTWTQQGENRPDATRDATGRVAGVIVCGYHRDVLGGLATAHGSLEGHARRVAQVAASCRACLEAAE